MSSLAVVCDGVTEAMLLIGRVFLSVERKGVIDEVLNDNSETIMLMTMGL